MRRPRFAAARRVLSNPGFAVARSEDAMALQALEPVGGGFLPWSRFALRPSAALAILNDIFMNEHRNVVELGSGLSTVLIARALAAEGGILHTVEDDERWATVVTRLLEREGLTDKVHWAIAPLEGGWYAHEALEPIPRDIDLLVVDGPVAATPEARYPALPYFASRLTKSATVILDDINRPGEQAIVDRWEAEFDRQFERRRVSGGIAVSLGKDSFVV